MAHLQALRRKTYSKSSQSLPEFCRVNGNIVGPLKKSNVVQPQKLSFSFIAGLCRCKALLSSKKIDSLVMLLPLVLDGDLLFRDENVNRLKTQKPRPPLMDR